MYNYLLPLLLLLSCSTAEQKSEPAGPFQNSFQLVVVTSAGDDSTAAQLSYFDKTTSGWEPVSSGIDVMLGRTGLAWGRGLHEQQSGRQKQEGDGKSPAGIFQFGTTFGKLSPGEITWKLPYVQVTGSLECVDDSESEFYNQIIDNQKVEKDWSSSERMWEVGEQYDWGVYVEHNNPAQAQSGSCIFLHVWKGPGEATSGCTAMKEEDLLALLHWLDPEKKPLLVQATSAGYQLLKEQYDLPVEN